MRVPVPLEVSMMSRAVLARTPLKQRIRDARGDNFSRSLVMFQVSYSPCGPRHCSACSISSKRVHFCGGSITTSPGSSCRSCGPRVDPRQVALTLTSVGSDSFRAASRKCRCTRATSSAALAGPCSCLQRTTVRGG